jgi:PAS domain S-box-containing protein
VVQLAIFARDITQRKKVENALRESEERYRSVVENSHAGILTVDGEYRFVYANDELCRILGRSCEAIIGHDFREFLDDETRDMIADRYVRRQRGEQVPSRYEFNLIRKDGEKRRVEISTSLIKDSAGNVRTVGQLLDITERAQAEEALRRSEERYALAQRAASIGSWDWNVQTGALHWSDEIEPMFGFGRGEFGATYEAFLERVHPEDRKFVIDSVDACIKEEKDYAIEHRIVWLDGTVRWVSEIGDFIRDEEGQVIRMLGVVQDITERKRAEEKISELARFPDENPYPVLRIAQDGAILYANEASAPMLGFWGCDIDECLPDDWRQLIRDALRSESSTEVEFEIQNRIFSLTFTPVVEERYVNVYGLDITERKEAAEALRLHAAELEARNAELDAFAHTVAHDLKNPLGLAIGYAKLLHKEYPTLSQEDVDTYLHTVVQNGYKMNTIIDELMLLSEVRKADVPATLLDMADIVAEAQQRLTHAIEEHQAEIVAPESWPRALGYGPWIEEVWANYLDNALKYGGRPPRIQLGAEVEPDNRVRFWVRDNGPGLAPDEQARLFTPFGQLGRGHAKGHGLGLSIVRRIVEKLDGQVGVESRVGQGSTFWFALPGDGLLSTSSFETATTS